LLDILIAFAGLALLSPLLVLVALLIRLTIGPPVLFRQVRPGYKGRSLTVYKFTTMNQARDASGELLLDEQRLTTVGRLLRRLSLDELPQLWNVLKGDMSLVGPRPLLMEFLPRYTAEELRRHDVPPGITGWAQVQGRHDILFSKRIQHDLWYVDHAGFWLDLKILFLTLGKVFSMSGSRPSQTDAEVDDLGLHANVPHSRKPLR
jgi:sugar transferase EpsL